MSPKRVSCGFSIISNQSWGTFDQDSLQQCIATLPFSLFHLNIYIYIYIHIYIYIISTIVLTGNRGKPQTKQEPLSSSSNP